MKEQKPSKILLQGAIAWNEWRKRNPTSLDFNAPHWYDCPGRDGRQLKGKNRINFSGMNFADVSIHKAFAEGLKLKNASFSQTHFEEGDFSRADFSGATFLNTRFNKTILTGANFEGATFMNCNLNRVNLVGANFCVKEITETVVYGISAWDLVTSEESKQSKLVIEKTYELYSDFIARGTVPLMVEDIELAQFVYYLSQHKKMRDALSILNDKGVLLLGRFKEGGLDRLYSLREWLQRKGYMAMIFDFERPRNLSLTETVVTMAGLSKFVLVDLSGGSVPAELASIFGQIKKPVLAFGKPFALFPDVEDQTKVVSVECDDQNLVNSLEKKLPKIEELHAERIMSLAQRYGKAPSKRKRIN